MQTDAKFLATVLDAATDPARRTAILRAATTSTGAAARMANVQAAAAILGVCPRTVERYARAGAFPHVHLSKRKVRYPLEAVEAFARQGRAP